MSRYQYHMSMLSLALYKWGIDMMRTRQAAGTSTHASSVRQCVITAATQRAGRRAGHRSPAHQTAYPARIPSCVPTINRPHRDGQSQHTCTTYPESITLGYILNSRMTRIMMTLYISNTSKVNWTQAAYCKRINSRLH